jgi:hypothetical protein
MHHNQASGPDAIGVAFTALLDAAGLTVDGVLHALPGDRRGQVSRSTLYGWKNGQHLPQDPGPLLDVVEVCLDAARQRGVTVAPDDMDGWLQLLNNRITAPVQPPVAQPSAAPAQPSPTSPSATIDIEVHITLDGTISDGARRQIIESVKNQTAAFTAKVREIERDDRAPGAEQAEFTASTVIKTNAELKRQNSNPQSGVLAISLAILSPIASGAAGVSGSYLHSLWQAIVFGATAMTAVIAIVLIILLPRLRSK